MRCVYLNIDLNHIQSCPDGLSQHSAAKCVFLLFPEPHGCPGSNYTGTTSRTAASRQGGLVYVVTRRRGTAGLGGDRQESTLRPAISPRNESLTVYEVSPAHPARHKQSRAL